MAKTIIDLTSTGLAIGDCTFSWCKKISDGTAVTTSGATLTERGNGIYVLDVTVTEDSDFRIYETATPANYSVGVFSPADGDIALASVTGNTYALAAGATGFAAIDTVVDTIAAAATEARLAELDAANLPTDVADCYARLGAPVGASIAADIATNLEAILTRLASSVYGSDVCPTAVTVTDGTILSGAYIDACSINRKYLKVQETGKFKIDFDFTGLSSTESVINMIYRYFGTGSSNHKVECLMWNYVTSAWDDMLATDRDFPGTDVDVNVEIAISGTVADYFTGVSPNIAAKVRIEHVSNFNTDHQFWIDFITLGALEQIYVPADNIGISTIREVVESVVYGNSALQALINAIPTTPMRGTDNAATEAKQDATDVVIAELTTQGDTNEAAIAALTLTGTRTITIQLYETATTTPIADVAVSVFNSDQTLFLGRLTTDANGQIVIGRDDGTYKLVFTKAGVTFTTPETMVVTVDATKTYYGDTFIIAAPADADVCRVYDYLFLADGVTKPSTITATAIIQSLPYDVDGKLHSGINIPEVYDANTGLVYWDIVQGATVKFKVDKFISTSKIIPSVPTVRLIEIT